MGGLASFFCTAVALRNFAAPLIGSYVTHGMATLLILYWCDQLRIRRVTQITKIMNFTFDLMLRIHNIFKTYYR